MEGTIVIEKVDNDKYDEIKQLIQSSYVIKSKNQNLGIEETFEIDNCFNVLFVTKNTR